MSNKLQQTPVPSIPSSADGEEFSFRLSPGDTTAIDGEDTTPRPDEESAEVQIQPEELRLFDKAMSKEILTQLREAGITAYFEDSGDLNPRLKLSKGPTKTYTYIALMEPTCAKFVIEYSTDLIAATKKLDKERGTIKRETEMLWVYSVEFGHAFVKVYSRTLPTTTWAKVGELTFCTDEWDGIQKICKTAGITLRDRGY